MKELKEISILKTIMMLLVVLYHSCLFFNGKWFTTITPVYEAKYLQIFTFWLNTFHIQTFTFASGFLFFYLKSIGKYKDTKKDIINRAKRLLLPLIITIVFWALPFNIYYFGFDFSKIFHKYILMENPSQLWFLPMLFWQFVIFNIFYKNIKHKKIELVVFFAVSILIGGILQKLNLNYFNIAKAVQFLIYFYLGGYVYKNKDKIFKYRKVIYIIVIPLLFYILFTYSIDNISIIKYINYVIEPILSCVEVIALYFIFDYLVNIKKINFNNKFVKILSDNSFGIYLFHQQIIMITITIFNGLVHPIIQCLLSFIISISISLLITLLLKKNKITKFMFGL